MSGRFRNDLVFQIEVFGFKSLVRCFLRKIRSLIVNSMKRAMLLARYIVGNLVAEDWKLSERSSLETKERCFAI